MEILRCPNGHFYDPSQTSSCPKCAQNSSMGGGSGMTTVPVDFNFQTEPVVAGNGGGFAGVMDTQPTLPNDPPVQDYAKTTPIDAPPDMVGGGASFVQDYTPTTPVGYGDSTVAGAAFSGIQPVVGWLVCVEGNNRGSDYRIHNGYNYIGRAQSMDICIPGDSHISNENAAIVAYDSMERLFYFGPGMGHNAVRLNGKMCLGQSELKAYDIITLGQTKLVFIPLCGERFDWDDR